MYLIAGLILLDFAKASIDLKRVIREKAKGDWSKLEILVENDPVAKESFDIMCARENDFIEATSLGRLFTHQKAFDRLFVTL